MKKFLLFICILLSLTAIRAQSPLVFKGIPIQGTRQEFVSKLKAKGFPVEETRNDIKATLLSGTFLDKDAFIRVDGTKKTDKVWNVVVSYDPHSNWYALKREYSKIVDLYKQKYTLEEEYEGFGKPYYEGDGYELQAVKLGKSAYVTFFVEGVFIAIEEDCSVGIHYCPPSVEKIRKDEETTVNLDDI